MLDYIIMGGILAFLFFLIAYKSKYNADGNNHFFDQNNSKAMRGFWCLIVILVHIPPTYQDKIQDMIGSFAYIGVTFFFMTSAYGLSAGIHKKPQLHQEVLDGKIAEADYSQLGNEPYFCIALPDRFW